MRVALLADRCWLEQESPTLRHLAVGLMDQQVSVVAVLPDQPASATENLALSSRQIVYRHARWRAVRDWNIRQLTREVRDTDPDLVHALSGSLERAAFRLADAMGIPAVCSVWSNREAERLVGPTTSETTAYGAATEAIATRCRQNLSDRGVEDASVLVTPPGVYSRSDPSLAPPLQRPEQALCCAVIGNGRIDDHYQALLDGIERARGRLGYAMFFFYTTEQDQHRIWQAAKARGLLDQISFVLPESDTWHLLIQADAVIQPQPLGQARTLMLEAMAAARPIIAATDAMLQPILTRNTAVLLDRPTPAQWAQAINDLVDQTRSLTQLGHAASLHVKQHYTVWAQVSKTLELYRSVTAPENLPFEPAAG